MKLYSKTKDYELYNGNMLDMLEVVGKESVDSIVCDPPYELNFMGKGWDNSGIAFNKESWQKCYEALKPGGYLLAFGGSRTFHRIACAIEDAGFEIRDTIMWLYGSGFPKGMNVGLAIDKRNGVDNKTGNIRSDGVATNSGSGCYNCNNGIDNIMKQQYEERKAQNEWAGWNTALKPSYEPIIVARKPFKGSLVDNVIKYGVGGINIDECRVGEGTGKEKPKYIPNNKNNIYGNDMGGGKYENANGRFPANVILTYDESDKEEVCGGMNNKDNEASRYFYCAKANKRDRDEGLDEFEDVNGGTLQFRQDGSLDGSIPKRKNIHTTVKPIELMQYLVRLVTPKNGVIMDCFMGSGSTGKAAMFENRERNANYHFIGIELTDEYLPICEARIDYALNKYKYDEEKEKNENKSKGILDIFDFLGEEQECKK